MSCISGIDVAQARGVWFQCGAARLLNPRGAERRAPLCPAGCSAGPGDRLASGVRVSRSESFGTYVSRETYVVCVATVSSRGMASLSARWTCVWGSSGVSLVVLGFGTALRAYSTTRVPGCRIPHRVPRGAEHGPKSGDRVASEARVSRSGSFRGVFHVKHEWSALALVHPLNQRSASTPPILGVWPGDQVATGSCVSRSRASGYRCFT